MLSWWLDSTKPSMQEIIYKIILEGTALFGHNCWNSVKTFEIIKQDHLFGLFESSAPLLIFVDQVVIFQIIGWKVNIPHLVWVFLVRWWE